MSKKSKRKAMRSGSSICPTCDQKHRLVEHHIHGKDIPDRDKPWNIAWVCPNCHDEVHAGEIIIEGWVMTTSGKELSWYRKDGQKPDLLPNSSPYTY